MSTNTGRSSLKSTTFVNTDGSMVTVVMNATEQNDQL
ncbi:glycoside hydrolase family 30 beta sandwich domain-containing protein [Robertkochia marina]